MESVKSTFTIKDLENLSGIKAHTIRIWEKRYNVLEPMRTETNIRYYDASNLQKLLNIVLLHNYGYKISKIAVYKENKIAELVQEIVSGKNVKNHAITSFKMAMMNFDQALFLKTYNYLITEKPFKTIFHEVFIPLMDEIGFLWQSNTISPAQEHFISYLIKQKILVNTEQLQFLKPTKSDKIFVLALPMNEIHELGLMYLNYEINLHGYKSIYLGESVPVEDLKTLKNHFSSLVYISYLTVQPEPEDVDDYVQKMIDSLLDDDTHLWYLGRLTSFISDAKKVKNLSIFNSIDELVANI